MATRQYVGARYVPKFATPTEWQNNVAYEALTIVTYMNSSYTSKIPVPPGIVPTDEQYWARTGDYNAQVEQYRQEVEQVKNDITTLETNTNNNFTYDRETLAQLGGKSILILGDSISDTGFGEQPNWVTQFTNMVQPMGTTVNNVSLSGRTIIDVSNFLAGVTGDYDIIILFVGVNDCILNTRLGWWDDSGNGSFYGAIGEVCKIIWSKWASANVFYISPLKTIDGRMLQNNPYQPLDLYRNAIYTQCRNYGWHFIDAHSNAPLLNPDLPFLKDRYQPDGLHINAAYAPIFAKYVISNLISKGDNAIGKQDNLIDVAPLLHEGVTGNINLLYSTTDNDLLIAYKLTVAAATVGANQLTEALPQWISTAYPSFSEGAVNTDTQNYETFITEFFNQMLYARFETEGEKTIQGIHRIKITSLNNTYNSF